MGKDLIIKMLQKTFCESQCVKHLIFNNNNNSHRDYNTLIFWLFVVRKNIYRYNYGRFVKKEYFFIFTFKIGKIFL